MGVDVDLYAKELKAWTPEEFYSQMLAKRNSYHLEHDFEKKLYAGELSQTDLQIWVANRFYYQANIPKKDAAILANSQSSEFRRIWIQRLIDQDGPSEGKGGIEAWIKLGQGLGVTREVMLSFEKVVPGVRFAVDAYVHFARTAPWQEAVCSSLTELFATTAHERRLEAFSKHYSYIPSECLTYFRDRLTQAKRDVDHGLTVTIEYFKTREAQEKALGIIQFKLDVLWSMANAISGAMMEGVER
jgi:pyrroloquinoline-quinone synthase